MRFQCILPQSQLIAYARHNMLIAGALAYPLDMVNSVLPWFLMRSLAQVATNLGKDDMFNRHISRCQACANQIRPFC